MFIRIILAIIFENLIKWISLKEANVIALLGIIMKTST